VDVVIVSWNDSGRLAVCLQSISQLERRGFALGDIAVVDNGSRTPLACDAPAGLAVTVIENDRNRGFAPACNQGAARGRGDYLLFLNPDTRLHPRSLDHAVGAIDEEPGASIGLVGFRLIDAQGVTQRTSGRFPGFRTIVNQTLGLTRVAPDHFRGIRLCEWSHDETREVDFVCGAALLVSRPLFEALGGFDERLFLYLEDADLALRARRLGWRARFCAEATVEHAGGWSSGSTRSWRLAHSWRSRLIYSWTHLGAARALAVLSVIVIPAPVARITEAVTERSWRTVAESVRAWFTLWRLLLHDVRTRALTTQPAARHPSTL
jgi:GT2 family glycosyltransferase